MENIIKGPNYDLIESFHNVEENEDETLPVLQSNRNIRNEFSMCKHLSMNANVSSCRIHYITDIHLQHRISDSDIQKKKDIINYINQNIIYPIIKDITDSMTEYYNLDHSLLLTDNIPDSALLLIGGDVSSDFKIFQTFVKLLANAIESLPSWFKLTVIFVLGNHELWSFEGVKFDKIVLLYRKFLEAYNMYLLQNDIIYKEGSDQCSPDDQEKYYFRHDQYNLISYNDLCNMSLSQINDKLRNAKWVIFGGLGFSGYNIEFNANHGVYNKAINREEDIEETKKFENMYNRLYPILKNKNTIILTHTPKKDWSISERPDKKIVYINGHTHRNQFYGNNEYRVYADNQIGYKKTKYVHLKSLLLDNNYDCFLDYDNGIYEITKEQYNNFYRGKNLPITFSRNVNILYMLKKNGYYCFMHKAKNGSLTILNGGSRKKLERKDVQYYYDNMDSMISILRTPLEKFNKIQKPIADAIKLIGGNGTIHGCIIDIDFFNHIYMNPVDLSTTVYWATNECYKIYPSFLDLIKERFPKLYTNEIRAFIEKNFKNSYPSINVNTEDVSENTILISNEIKKIQKINSQILSVWYENVLQKNNITGIRDNNDDVIYNINSEEHHMS